jgi:predicted transcriptional regulator
VSTPEPTITQNITVRLDRRTLRKAKVLAAKRNTSISALLARQIEALVGEDDAYEQAQRRALALLDQGFHLGGRIESTRDQWHER